MNIRMEKELVIEVKKKLAKKNITMTSIIRQLFKKIQEDMGKVLLFLYVD